MKAAALPASTRTRPAWAGSWLTTDEKISSDIPLPMPRWVMSSPIHMSRAVPAVRVSTMSSTRGTVKFGIRSRPVVFDWPNPPPPLWNRNARPVDCITAMATVR